MSLHVECGYAGKGGMDGRDLPLEQGDGLLWAETLASTSASTQATPADPQQRKHFVMTLTPEVDMWVGFGTSGANALAAAGAAATRRRLKAGLARSFSLGPGQYVGWV